MNIISKIDKEVSNNNKEKPLVKLPWNIKTIIKKEEDVMLIRLLKIFLRREDTTIDEQVKSLKKLIQDGYINCNSLFQINIDSILEPNIPKANKDILKESINIIKELEICKKETGTGKRKSRKKHKTKKNKTKKNKTKKNKTKKNKTKKHKMKKNKTKKHKMKKHKTKK
jgi:hypothetical protein